MRLKSAIRPGRVAMSTCVAMRTATAVNFLSAKASSDATGDRPPKSPLPKCALQASRPCSRAKNKNARCRVPLLPAFKRRTVSPCSESAGVPGSRLGVISRLGCWSFLVPNRRLHSDATQARRYLCILAVPFVHTLSLCPSPFFLTALLLSCSLRIAHPPGYTPRAIRTCQADQSRSPAIDMR